MKNTTLKALCALLTLTTLAPAYGMHALKRSFSGYQTYKQAVPRTLGWRLLGSTSAFKQTFKAAQHPRTLQVQPAVTKSNVGFFGKLLGFFGITSLWQSKEEQCANTILTKPAIRDSLTTADWNPNHPLVGKYVFETCKRNKIGAKECGTLYKDVQELLEKRRLSELGILSTKHGNRKFTKEEELRKSINNLATDYTQGAIQANINDNGTIITVPQASDAQIDFMLSNVENSANFSICKHKETQERLCKPARAIALQQLKAFRDSVQSITPAAPAITSAKPTATK